MHNPAKGDHCHKIPYRKYVRVVYNYAWRRVGEQAPDIVSETFLVAWRRMPELPDDEQLPWQSEPLRHSRIRSILHGDPGRNVGGRVVQRPAALFTGWPARLPRLLRATSTTVQIALLAAIVWVVGERGHAFTGVPKGYDATGHLSKAAFIASNWPHVSWNYEWYSGQPTFAGSYPPGYHVLLVWVSWVGHVSLPTAMNAVTFGSVALLVTAGYATVRAATGSHLAGLLTAGLVIASPTMWSQNVVLGLYPRFTALAFAAAAAATAVVFVRRHGRVAAIGTVLLLGVALSMHPIVGAFGLVLVAAVVVLGQTAALVTRMVLGAALGAIALLLTAYFYLPLALEQRSQSLFTNTEVPLTWNALGLARVSTLDTLPIGVLPVAVVVTVVVALLLRRPRVSHESKVALGTDVLLLAEPPAEGDLPASAGADVRRYARWHRRCAEIGYPLRLCLLCAAGMPWFLAYGFLGHVDKNFPYYINGFQPKDLLIYPAWLCSLLIGLATGTCVQRLKRRRAERRPRLQGALAVAGAAVTRLSFGAAMTAAVAVPLVALLPHIAPDTSINDSAAQRARLTVFPAKASGQRDYRVAGMGDSVTKWLNEYSDAPQDRGYDDHGALHFDWQNWLEQAVNSTSFSPAARDFLLDWYAIKWVDTDTGDGDVSQYGDTTRFRLLATETNYATLSSYLYEQAKPITSAVNAPTVFVIGDAQHYDLFLRALSHADIGSDQLIPVQGPASLDDVSPADLAHFDCVFLYGTTIGDASRDAKLLATYVQAGGGLVVDAADNETAMQELAKVKQSPLPLASVTDVQIKGPEWAWTPTPGDPLLSGIDVDAFAPASYAGSNRWSVAAAKELRPWAHIDLESHGKPVVISGRLGQGEVVWSGLGLPYHIDAFTSSSESAFLAQFFRQAATRPSAGPPKFSSTFIDPQHRQVDVASNADGVLLKEQDAPDWHATVDGRRTRIYQAGPGMMWVPLPDDGKPHVVDVQYRLSAVEKLGYGLSIVTLIALLALLASRRLWGRGGLLVHRLLVGGSALLDPQPTWRHRLLNTLGSGPPPCAPPEETREHSLTE